MRMRKIFCCLFVMVLLVVQQCMPAVADVFSPGDDFYYLDEADVLSQETEGRIFFSNQLLEEACGAQIVIVAIDTTGNQAIDDYAYELFNEWGIGDSKEHNGFLLLMAIEDEDYYAIAGTGLDFKFSSGTIGNYLDKYLEPDFAKADYDAGAAAFFDAAFERIADAYNAKVSVKDGIAAYEAYIADANTAGNGSVKTSNADRGQNVAPEYDSTSTGVSPMLIIIGLIIILAVLSSRNKRRSRGTQTVYTQKTSGGSFWLPFILGRMSGNASRITTFTPPPNRNFHRSSGSSFHVGGFGGARPGGGRSSGFGSVGRSSGFSSGGFSSGRSGFGGARGGGGGSRGGGAGRGRR